MALHTGYVRPDGTSPVLDGLGIHDMASQASNYEIDPEVEKRLKALLIEAKETTAKFKLEVFFRSGAKRNVDVRGCVAVWSNGGFMNGGGDAAVYLCSRELPAPSGGGNYTCLAPIDMRFTTPSEAVCTRCRTVTHPKHLVGQIQGDVPLYKWARLLHRLFHVLDCDADLRMAINRGSVHAAVEQEMTQHKGGEVYGKLMGKRDWITYPLAGIVKDTASGATLENRIKAFLEA